LRVGLRFCLISLSPILLPKCLTAIARTRSTCVKARARPWGFRPADQISGTFGTFGTCWVGKIKLCLCLFVGGQEGSGSCLGLALSPDSSTCTWVHTLSHSYLHSYFSLYLHSYIQFLHSYTHPYIYFPIPRHIHTHIPPYTYSYIHSQMHGLGPSHTRWLDVAKRGETCRFARVKVAR
jgi:hypothetical protein